MGMELDRYEGRTNLRYNWELVVRRSPSPAFRRRVLLVITAGLFPVKHPLLLSYMRTRCVGAMYNGYGHPDGFNFTIS